MDETILRMLNKPTLKSIALDKGLSRRGFNNRTMSRMRKQDFVDFILFKNRNSASSADADARLGEQSGRARGPFTDEEVFNLFRELIMDEPLIRITSYSGEDLFADYPNIVQIFGRSQERVPNDEDENVPCLSLEEPVQQEKNCGDDCECDICQRNSIIKRDNLKVKTNIQDMEHKIACVVCQSNMRNVIFSPCNHLATCIACSKNPLLGDKCPLCRKPFNNTFRIFY